MTADSGVLDELAIVLTAASLAPGKVSGSEDPEHSEHAPMIRGGRAQVRVLPGP
jgi:hypothetical protein